MGNGDSFFAYGIVSRAHKKQWGLENKMTYPVSNSWLGQCFLHGGQYLNPLHITSFKPLESSFTAVWNKFLLGWLVFPLYSW